MFKANPGDIFFFQKPVSPIFSSSAPPAYRRHLGLFVDDNLSVIHSMPEKGVIKDHFLDAISDYHPIKIQIYQCQCSEERKKNAIKFAYSILGAGFNDLMSANFINSKNEKSFYCSQLIQEAFGHDMFPSTTLDFKDENGNFVEHWKKVFEKLGRPIPHGEPGIQPSIFVEFKLLKLMDSFEVENGRFVRKELLDSENYVREVEMSKL